MSVVKVLQPKRVDYSTEKGGGQRVVEFYLRARFAGITLSDGERHEMGEALGAARKSLR